jgi:hypothetical protein
MRRFHHIVAGGLLAILRGAMIFVGALSLQGKEKEIW